MKPIAKVLVGVEFTDAGRSALNEAQLLARMLGAEVVLLHALPDVGARDKDATAVVAHAERMLEKEAKDLEADEVRVARPFLLPVGKSPAEALLGAIVEVRPDLVVVGANAKSKVDRLLVGSTAERLVAESPRPLWLTRPGKDHGVMKRLVCAVDASEPAHEALAAAAFLARTFVAKLVTVSVVPEGAGAKMSGDRAVRAALGRIDLHGIDHEVVIREGKPVSAIVEAVAEREADLLILGSARRTGVARLVHANTAEKVLRQVPCSVLTVPANAAP